MKMFLEYSWCNIENVFGTFNNNKSNNNVLFIFLNSNDNALESFIIKKSFFLSS